ncbi:hypothetical protein VTN96DRAFT_4016 [Rasamsonia emersonii]
MYLLLSAYEELLARSHDESLEVKAATTHWRGSNNVPPTGGIRHVEEKNHLGQRAHFGPSQTRGAGTGRLARRGVFQLLPDPPAAPRITLRSAAALLPAGQPGGALHRATGWLPSPAAGAAVLSHDNNPVMQHGNLVNCRL